MKLFKRRQSLVGVDIGSSTIKLLALRRHRGTHQLTYCLDCPLPAGVVREKSIVAAREIATPLRALLASNPELAHHCVLAVPGSSVISRLMALDAALSEPELLAQVEFEAQQHVPYPREDVLLDFVPRPDLECAPGQRMVLLAACRRDQVENRLAVMQAAGAEVAAVDGEAWAMERAFALLCAHGVLPADGLTAIVDCGAQTCTVHVLRNGRSFYCREHACGALQAWQEADPPDLPGSSAREEALRIALAEQVERALRLFLAYGEHPQLDRVVLAGGGATVPELASWVEQRLALPVMLADPFAVLNPAPAIEAVMPRLRRQAAAWMLACGLALHGGNHG